MFKLVPNWKSVLTWSASMWVARLTTLATCIAASVNSEGHVIWWLVGCHLAIEYSRLVDQQGLDDGKAQATAGEIANEVEAPRDAG